MAGPIPGPTDTDSEDETMSSESCCGPSPKPSQTASSCCGSDASTGTTSSLGSQEAVRETVRRGYATIAEQGQWSSVVATESSCCAPSPSGGGCCGPATLTADDVARAVGYATEDLASLPEGANLGLSCGNPTALAALSPGEVVLDLGSGAGFDCFLAGPRVGATGRVIGVDMTPEMISRARRNLDAYRDRSGLDNVEFRLGEIEHLPLADASVDVVISNCVLNLSPDKAQTWREIARVLKPGGRVAVSDLALLRPLPESVRADVEALVGCVAGAVLLDETIEMARAAGLANVEAVTKPEYVAALENVQDPLYRSIAEKLPAGVTAADLVTSADVRAVKPTR